jgi:hypothetical protein
MPLQDFVTDLVQPGLCIALIEAKENIHAGARPHGLDRDLVRVAGSDADDE